MREEDADELEDMAEDGWREDSGYANSCGTESGTEGHKRGNNRVATEWGNYFEC